MNSRENRAWAWGVGGFTLVLLAIAGASREDDESASFVASAVVGRLLACIAIAYGLRFLWLRVIRRDNESELTPTACARHRVVITHVLEREIRAEPGTNEHELVS